MTSALGLTSAAMQMTTRSCSGFCLQRLVPHSMALCVAFSKGPRPENRRRPEKRRTAAEGTEALWQTLNQKRIRV